MSTIRILFNALLFVLLITGLTVSSAQACVGKTLVVGALDNPQQRVLAEMLSVLIGERTGTTVKVVSVAGHAEAHDAMIRAEMDMYVEYTGVGQVIILKEQPIADSDELYKAVKERYNQDLNLVWLKPFGFSDERYAPEGTVAVAAPVVRKDTLKKFPALARLINKLGGSIDDPTMKELETASAAGNSRDVARKFLKEKRFI
ncbi:glycine betaine ABC transporter substrate-binding protein [Deltaproteobacteria bacterium IMCC39524]|nr:glycine betaine ABC transporter substrate-binding protein [Deltaproteobacteria bacterium IMCC39524]